jgi:hypothetical protein
MQEAEAAHTIAQRGVILVGTAHGIDLSSLLKNPDLVRLVGGVSAVTLGDAAAAKSNSNKKVRHGWDTGHCVAYQLKAHGDERSKHSKQVHQNNMMCRQCTTISLQGLNVWHPFMLL